jgi:4-hydroxybenzoate polyprenyltransferase
MAGKIISKIRDLAEMVKVSHTIFALPFALASMLVAAGGFPSARILALVLVAMFTARNTGMAFNRYLDAAIDARNPRTASRHIPRGIFSRPFVLAFALVNAALFVAAAGFLNRLCLELSPIALGLLFSYSAMKRFTSLSHLVLGLTLGASPVAAWAAVRGTLSWEPFVLGAAVLFWVAGFDVIYATQDYEFDKKEGLHSLAVALGIRNALRLSRVFHILTLALFAAFGWLLHLGIVYNACLAVIAALLAYEHSLVKPHDLSRVNAAFFNVNGCISLLFLIGVFIGR